MLFLVFITILTALNSCGQNKSGSKQPVNSSTSDPGVVINGVKWATRNVDYPGTFAARPEDSGMFYQWNRKKAWPATGDEVIGWDSSILTGDTWEKTNDPSPAGWRVPTLDEIEKLLDTDKVSNEWTTQNGVNGRKFTDKTTGNSLFLPAEGYRSNDDGTLYGIGTSGGYWGSAQSDSGGAYVLDFDSDDADWLSYYRFGRSIRAVAE